MPLEQLSGGDAWLLDALANDYGWDADELAVEASLRVEDVRLRMEEWHTAGYVEFSAVRPETGAVWHLTADGWILSRQQVGLVLRGRGTFDGVASLADAAQRLRDEAARLDALAASGWRLDGTCIDDHGSITPPGGDGEAHPIGSSR
jgi:hypothetical protein